MINWTWFVTTYNLIYTLKYVEKKVNLNIYMWFKIVTLEHVEILTGSETGLLISSLKLRPKIIEQLEERRLSINQAHKEINSDLISLTIS